MANERADPASDSPSVAVVIPCYRAAATLSEVIAGIGAQIDRIYVIDDGCPDGSGEIAAAARAADPRIEVLRNGRNLGVGGAVKRGYAAALERSVDIVVKLDADGQMDPAFIPFLCEPILAGRADYAKGNRLAPRRLMPREAGGSPGGPMPPIRRVGNTLLSLLHKGVTGYWSIADPANGYTAIHRRALVRIDLEAVADCYFFETDILVQLNLVDALVEDVPLPARYSGEVSSLCVKRFALRFPRLALGRFARRIAVKYLRTRPPATRRRLRGSGP